jgi:hypothetical protein
MRLFTVFRGFFVFRPFPSAGSTFNSRDVLRFGMHRVRGRRGPGVRHHTRTRSRYPWVSVGVTVFGGDFILQCQNTDETPLGGHPLLLKPFEAIFINTGNTVLFDLGCWFNCR